MCENCDNNDPFADFSFDQVLKALQFQLNDMRKTPEQVMQEKNDEIEQIRNSVIHSYSVTDNVKLHVLEHTPQYQVNNLVKWLRHLNEIAPASGLVNVYTPFTMYSPDGAVDAFTTKVTASSRVTINGMLENTPHRMVVLSHHVMNEAVTAADVNTDDPKWSMPTGAHVSNLYYTLVHEWAHVIDNRRADDNSQRALMAKMNGQGLLDPYSPFESSLSTYAHTSEVEAFAECFAEWHISKGRTSNFATKWYAKEYDWYQYNNYYNNYNKYNV